VERPPGDGLNYPNGSRRCGDYKNQKAVYIQYILKQAHISFVVAYYEYFCVCP
jgi:hypothetical protein